MHRILAVDPGESWCGVAALRISRSTIDAETRVLHVPERKFGQLIDDLSAYILPADVVCEDYRVRPVGHQHWTSGRTLRIMGGLQYVTETRLESTWQTVPPGNPKEVPELAGALLSDWWSRWPDEYRSNAQEWNHAHSAWRVLLRHLLKTDPDLLMWLRSDRCVKSYRACARWLPVNKKPSDLIAPAASWRVRT